LDDIETQLFVLLKSSVPEQVKEEKPRLTRTHVENAVIYSTLFAISGREKKAGNPYTHI